MYRPFLCWQQSPETVLILAQSPHSFIGVGGGGGHRFPGTPENISDVTWSAPSLTRPQDEAWAPWNNSWLTRFVLPHFAAYSGAVCTDASAVSRDVAWFR